MAITLVPYTREKGPEWDKFVQGSKNGTFLFMRGYMEYHADRFTDASLMAYEADLAKEGNAPPKLVAILPANRKTTESGDVLQSHGGLTYGGWVTDGAMTTPRMLELMDALRAHLRLGGYHSCLYKVIPTFYHQLPAEEDLYALFRQGARLTRMDISSTIPLATPPALAKGRKYAVSVARKHHLEVRKTEDFDTFFTILTEVLRARHEANPTHSAAEMQLLAARFPANIKLYGTFNPAGDMLAGTVIYDCGPTVHTQYMATTLAGRDIGALDLLITTLFQQTYASRKFFDFGISTTAAGTILNTGLVAQKEMFGGRPTVHQFYEILPA